MDTCSDNSCPTREDAIEAKAFIDLHDAAHGLLADEERFECVSMNGGCTISLPSAPAIGLNRILGLTKSEDLDKAYDWMRQRAGKRFLQVNADAASDEVKHWIQSKGLTTYGPGWAKLRRTADAVSLLSPSTVKTRKVRQNEAEVFGAMMCAGFGFPENLTALWAAIVGRDGWSCFYALDGDTPVGTGAMFASESSAWLGGGTTVPGFRNRGAQKALIQARLEHGADSGVSTFVVETEVPSAEKANISNANLAKLGFVPVYNRSNFIL
ncbi:GNAT family N-acetyltransferase [Rhizobium ruizarguesonis]|uniref:GNAT family N-acetyltransferase n=1 Tax=Rhizobium ruizarguesonis TaxID=2081791 RepID=UPI001031A754|nr:GNAT family N-acetyltransferase [Rhizobium ruizarguesonis]TBC89012.1 GNAT family N-acetyltransferase [Rhizobium ruizarguesonis]TBD07994.1 GNAT family N-acetyltransferase [Rhizobium ruizarguesonis]TBD24738.1 GNAT family N-acetyltransferase [Rhizobium ruizarguesonis]TBD31231.1 GNAT family N-acetyltransferase [Rhizobium ruizarguesonis]TBD33840.1 GNAT family N-acetyltransferase [Rhizobium ruizarguesonis]